jgi:hypothetical protein
MAITGILYTRIPNTHGVMIHKNYLIGVGPVSSYFRISMCYTLIRRGELERAHKVREFALDSNSKGILNRMGLESARLSPIP